MIGREREVDKMRHLLNKNKSSFLAVTGRRRVGKTYLIDHFFKKHICYRVTGIQNVSMENQMRNFIERLEYYSKKPVSNKPADWQEVFVLFRGYLESLDKKKKQVIFMDELPWIATARTGFIQLLAHLWNDYLSKQNHFVLVICGSASSWITDKIVNDTGGLHNRLTDLIALKPFSLNETAAFLKSIKVRLNQHEMSKLYMTFGGIPYYLEQIRTGESAAVAIERICFSDDGTLKNEYVNLYRALFRKSENHESIVSLLAIKSTGLNRKELLKGSKVAQGGTFNRTMNELVSCGFVSEFTPFGRVNRGMIYRLTDEFSIFYHRFMKPNKRYSKGQWLQLSASQSYKIWTGYAFENLVILHVDQVKKSLGIGAVYTEFSSFRYVGGKKTKGFQIDLIIDRKDQVINLCEIKFYNDAYKVTKRYAEQLYERKNQFVKITGTKKQVFTTLITNNGLEENEHSTSVVDSQLVLADLFD